MKLLSILFVFSALGLLGAVNSQSLSVLRTWDEISEFTDMSYVDGQILATGTNSNGDNLVSFQTWSPGDGFTAKTTYKFTVSGYENCKDFRVGYVKEEETNTNEHDEEVTQEYNVHLVVFTCEASSNNLREYLVAKLNEVEGVTSYSIFRYRPVLVKAEKERIAIPIEKEPVETPGSTEEEGGEEEDEKQTLYAAENKHDMLVEFMEDQVLIMNRENGVERMVAVNSSLQFGGSWKLGQTDIMQAIVAEPTGDKFYVAHLDTNTPTKVNVSKLSGTIEDGATRFTFSAREIKDMAVGNNVLMLCATTGTDAAVNGHTAIFLSDSLVWKTRQDIDSTSSGPVSCAYSAKTKKFYHSIQDGVKGLSTWVFDSETGKTDSAFYLSDINDETIKANSLLASDSMLFYAAKTNSQTPKASLAIVDPSASGDYFEDFIHGVTEVTTKTVETYNAPWTVTSSSASQYSRTVKSENILTAVDATTTDMIPTKENDEEDDANNDNKDTEGAAGYIFNMVIMLFGAVFLA